MPGNVDNTEIYNLKNILEAHDKMITVHNYFCMAPHDFPRFKK